MNKDKSDRGLLSAESYLRQLAAGRDPFAKAFAPKPSSCPLCGGAGSTLCPDHQFETAGSTAEAHPVGRPIPKT